MAGQVYGVGPLYVAYNGDWYAKGCVPSSQETLRTWDEIAGGKTWDELKGQTWDDIATNGVPE